MRAVPRLAFRHSAGIVLAGLILAAAASAAPVDPRLSARLDAETASAVSEIIDAAGQKGLPTEPLVARALEGASRQAPGARIVASVRALASDLATARELLGAGAASAELVAGATALSAGVKADTLPRLRAARPGGSLVVPLVVLTDLITRRVPVETASAAVLAATRAGVKDKELMKLRQRIDRDIRAGVQPGNATVLRTRNLIGHFEGVGTRPAPPGEGRPGSGP